MRKAAPPTGSAHRRPATALLLCALALAGGRARAAGLSIPDLGAIALGEGCARMAAPDDFSALYYNPAGLAGQDGLRLQLDSRVSSHRVGFQRLADDGTNPRDFVHVTNSGGISLASLAPLGGVSWRWNGGPVPLTLAFGGWPNNGATGYNYPDPSALRASGFSEGQVAQLTPQRYASIQSGSKIYTAATGVGARVLPWLDVGATFQLAFAQFSSKQAVASGVVAGENTQFDAGLQITGRDFGRPTGSVGLTARLPWGLHLGASYQLSTRFAGDGDLKADLTPTLNALGARLIGDQMQVSVTLPWLIRMGIRLVQPAFEVEVAGTVEGWHQMDEVTITPHDVTVQVAGQTVELPVLHLRKDLRNAGSVRVGGSYRLGQLNPLLFPFVLRAGGLVETSAVPESRQSLDLMHWARGAISGGLGLRLGSLSIDAGYMHYVQPTRQVRTSQVQQVVALPGPAPAVVGNGDYDSVIDLFSISVAWRFD